MEKRKISILMNTTIVQSRAGDNLTAGMVKMLLACFRFGVLALSMHACGHATYVRLVAAAIFGVFLLFAK